MAVPPKKRTIEALLGPIQVGQRPTGVRAGMGLGSMATEGLGPQRGLTFIPASAKRRRGDGPIRQMAPVSSDSPMESGRGAAGLCGTPSPGMHPEGLEHADHRASPGILGFCASPLPETR